MRTVRPFRRTEDDEAIAFVQEFALRWPHLIGKLIHVANEGGIRSADGSHFGKLAKRRRMGVTPGVSDYLLRGDRDRRPLWLELKAEGGKLKPEQLAFLEDVVRDGDAGVVAWGAWSAVAAVRAHLIAPIAFPEVLAYTRMAGGPMRSFTMTGELRKRAANGQRSAKGSAPAVRG